MSDLTLSELIRNWKQEMPAKAGNEVARSLLDTVDAKRLQDELLYYIYSLINGPDHPNCIQAKRAEGPEDYPILLNAVETLKRYKARIRAIGLETESYIVTARKQYTLVEKTLSLKPEFQAIKTAEQRKAVAQLVASDVYEFIQSMETVVEFSKEVAKEYNEYFNALALEYNIVNAMSYHRNLYGAAQDPRDNVPRRHF